MISKIQIKNYKSVQDLSIDVGQFNVLIGENGSGKSNLLEAITFAAAAASNCLRSEFLYDRGIRVTSDPLLMRTAFEHQTNPIEISVLFKDSEVPQKYILQHDNKPYSQWEQFSNREQLESQIREKFLNLIELETFKNASKENEAFKNFLIYSPTLCKLKDFSNNEGFEPLGCSGEGFFKLLEVTTTKSPEKWQELINLLRMFFDWFDDLDILYFPDQLHISNRYLVNAVDERSVPDSFLFVLFYLVLMISEHTPKMFAIENIDKFLNPKLCTGLIMELTRLAKKYDKQVFVTTHNPAILDGIDLVDERLFVLSKNRTGQTRVKRIELADKPQSSNNENLKLSEAFLRGYLGGLPKGF